MRIGVLALQGAVTEHVRAIEACGETAVIVKDAETLAHIDGLLLPGGESSAMRRLIDYNDMLPDLQQFAQHKPVFGTCAGLILLAETVDGEDAHIGAMRITVERNAFGRQVDSFETDLAVKGLDTPFHAVFIRAPKITAIGKDVEVLATYNENIVFARDRHLLACSFHPELTNDTRLIRYFIAEIVQKHPSRV